MSSEERAVPGVSSPLLLQQHINRYLFAATFAQGKIVLDAACGSGYGAPILIAGGACCYYGLDISAPTIKRATELYSNSQHIHFAVDNVCQLDTIKDRVIDVVVSFETIEHVTDFEAMLGNIRRVLKPGGILIISTPNCAFSAPQNTLETPPENEFHIREWNYAELLDLLSGHFEIHSVYGQEVTNKFKHSLRGFLMQCGLLPLVKKLKKLSIARGGTQPLSLIPPEFEQVQVKRLTPLATAIYLIFVGVNTRS